MYYYLLVERGDIPLNSRKLGFTSSSTKLSGGKPEVLLALIVCLVFSCFKPSTNYDTAMKSADGGYSQGAKSRRVAAQIGGD